MSFDRNYSRSVVARVAASILVLVFATLLAPGPFLSTANAQAPGDLEFSYGFESDAEGWTAGFADLPADYDQAIYELDSEFRALPEGLEGNGIYLRGHNRSDDLFMFIKKQVEELTPGASYRVTASIDLATNVMAGLMGIGGSPGESVYVKAGAAAVEPITETDGQGWLRMNIDKGNQANRGAAMAVLGNIAHPEVMGDEYRIKTLVSLDSPIEVTADDDGRLWLIAGTDSGFEGPTAIYYSNVAFTLSAVEAAPIGPVTPPAVGGATPSGLLLALTAAVGALLVGMGLTVRRTRRQR